MSQAFASVKNRCPVPDCLVLQVHYHVAFGTRYRYEPRVDDQGWRVFVQIWENGEGKWIEGNSYEVVAK